MMSLPPAVYQVPYRRTRKQVWPNAANVLDRIVLALVVLLGCLPFGEIRRVKIGVAQLSLFELIYTALFIGLFPSVVGRRRGEGRTTSGPQHGARRHVPGRDRGYSVRKACGGIAHKGLPNVVVDGLTGCVCDLSPEALASTIAKAIRRGPPSASVLEAARKCLGKERWEAQVWHHLERFLSL